MYANKALSPVAFATEVFNDSMNNVREDAERIRFRMSCLKDVQRRAKKIVSDVVSVLGMDNVERAHIIAPYWQSDNTDIMIATNDVDGMRAAPVERTINYLLENGWDAVNSRDYNGVLVREHTFKRDNFTLRFEVNVRSDSKTCRVVEVGEEIRVVKKYVNQCD